MARLSKIVIGLYSASLLLWAFLWKGRLPYHIDARLYAYPDHAFNLQCFHDGYIPLWNPFIGCGVPQLANWQSACFYPPFWLFNFTGLNNWLMWLALVHAGLAFFGCYLWLKSQKAGLLWSACGALSFAGSAHLVSCWANIPFIATACWIPWIFWAAQRALQNPIFPNWAWLGIFIGLQVLAGYPFFTLYTLIFLFIWFTFQRPVLKMVFYFGATLALTALATSLQWLPFLEFLTYSWHDSWTDYPYFTKPVEYLTLLEPNALGFPGDAAYQGSFANAPFNLYLGFIPLALLAFNVLRLYRPPERFWTLSACVWLAWLAGRRLFLWRWLPEPFLEFIEPSKAVGLFVFCAVTSVAKSLSRVRWDKNGALRWAAPFLTVLWVADLLWVPFRLERPMPNPYDSVLLKGQAISLKKMLQGERMVSLHPSQEMSFSGPKAAEDSFYKPTWLFLPNSNMVWDLPLAQEYLFLQVDGSQNLTRYINRGFAAGYPGGLFDVAGVRLLLMPQVPPGGVYRSLGRWWDDLLLLNPEASVPLRWVPEKMEFPTRPDVLNQLSLQDKGWETKVYLQKNPDGTLVELKPLGRKNNNQAPRGYQRPCGSKASLATNFTGPGYLVFNESFAPGWHAWVDGTPLPILRAYGLFMAVAMPSAGTHQVDFRYELVSFRLGLFLALAAMAFTLIGFLRSYLSSSGST